MNYLIYRFLYNQFFLNVEGIKLFANRCINRYINKQALNKANTLTAYVAIIKEERAKANAEFLACEQLDRMDDGSFMIKQKKNRSSKIAVYFMILFEIFLNYVSTLIFIQGDGLLFVIVRWGLAIILALAAMLSTDALLSNILPEESVRVKGKKIENDDTENYKNISTKKRMISLFISSLCLVCFEIAIIGVASKRAFDLEQTNSGVMFFGFILLSVALPILAGYFKWNSEHHGKLYQNSLKYYKTKNTLHILNLILTGDMKDVKDVIDISIKKAWNTFSTFQLYKENYNRKNNIPDEVIEGRYFSDIESFKIEALNHFGNEVKEILRELETVKK